MLVFDETVKSFDLCPINHMLDHESFEGHELDHINVDLVENFPSSIVKDESCAFDKGYLSDCCMFVQVLLSLPPFNDSKIALDLEVKNGYYDGGPFDGVYNKLIVYANHTTW